MSEFQGISARGRTLAQVDAGNYAAALHEMTRQEGLEQKRQARIRRERARRKARFIMPPPAVSAAARIDKTRLMGCR